MEFWQFMAFLMGPLYMGFGALFICKNPEDKNELAKFAIIGLVTLLFMMLKD